MQPAYLNHLVNSESLVTTRDAKRAGFVSAILEKSVIADAFVADARTLKVKAEKAQNPEDLLSITEIQAGLLTAAGVSDKAVAYLDANDRREILGEYIERCLKPAGSQFVEELVYRFLLTRGDKLGGQIRNLVGKWAQLKFSEYVVANFRIAGKTITWLDSDTNIWKPEIELTRYEQARAFNWQALGASRVLVYNLKVPIIQTDEEIEDDSGVTDDSAHIRGGKNVDICLLDCTAEDFRIAPRRLRIVKDPSRYIALGELKGGIDPAGADEHWKTANSHLGRIRKSFAASQSTPSLFFAGNAIEISMAGEIWGQLVANTLSNAANMTDHRQAISLISWLCNL